MTSPPPSRPPPPTLLEWIGGPPALERLLDLFYQRVPQDPVVGPVFAHMGPDHAKHVAAYLEWGSRLAVINSRPGTVVDEKPAMPKWGWGEAGGAYRP